MIQRIPTGPDLRLAEAPDYEQVVAVSAVLARRRAEQERMREHAERDERARRRRDEALARRVEALKRGELEPEAPVIPPPDWPYYHAATASVYPGATSGVHYWKSS